MTSCPPERAAYSHSASLGNRPPAQEQLGIEDQKEAVDRYHLSERLGKVLKVTLSDEAKRSKKLAKWEKQLDKDDGAIDQIARYIKKQVARLGEDAPESLIDTQTYIANNKDRMRYATLRAAGLPVGSGATEGSCKSLAGSRLKRSGQRWHHQGASSVGELRAIYQSDRFPRFWRHLHRRYQAPVMPVPAESARAA